MLRPLVLGLSLSLGLGLPGATLSMAETVPATAAPTPATAWPHEASDLAPDPIVRFGTLPNGMRYAIASNANPPGAASMRLRIDAGSLHEAEDQRGLAHFLEHMVLNGTRKLPGDEFMRRLERLGLAFGPDTNATTEFQSTTYMLELPRTDAETLGTALLALREVASEATLDPEAIEAERGVVLAEERTRATPAYRFTVDELEYLLKGQLLPRRMPIGSVDVIRSAPRERLLAFYQAYYRPERAVLIAIGDFDVDQMEAHIKASFGTWAGIGPAGVDPDLGQVAPRGIEARIFVDPGIPSRTSIGWLKPPDLRQENESVRLSRVVDQIVLQIFMRRMERLAAGASPPFIQSWAGSVTLSDSADLAQVAAIHAPGGWEAALAALERETRRIAEFGVTQAELDRVFAETDAALTKAAAGSGTRLSSEIANGIVASIATRKVFTSPATALDLFKRWTGEITVERVNAAARALFRGEGPLLYTSSATPIEGGEAALVAAYQRMRQTPVAAGAAAAAAVWPYTDFGPPGEVIERREIAEIGVTAVRFANGVRLTIKPTTFQAGEILISVRVGSGRLDLPSDRPSPEWGIAGGAILAAGLEALTLEDLNETLASKAFSATLSVDEDAFRFSGTTRKEDLTIAIQVLAAYVAKPGWRSTGWDRQRSASASIHSYIRSGPRTVWSFESESLVRSGDRRWAIPTEAEMAASTIADARAVLESPFARGPLEVIIAGDVAVDQAIAEVGATFGALPERAAKRAEDTTVRFPAGIPEPVRLTHQGRADQGLAFIAWPTVDLYSDLRTKRALYLLGEVFRLRLMAAVREKEGITYTPEAGQVGSGAVKGYGYFYGLVEVPPEKIDGVLAQAEEIAKDLGTTPIDDDELKRTRQPLVEQVRRGRATNAWWLSRLESLQDDPRVLENITSEIALYESLAADDLKAVAERFLKPETAWKMTVVPQEPR